MKNLRNFLALVLFYQSVSHAAPVEFSKPSVLDGQVVDVKLTPAKKGLVLIFLSAVCPCSNSHIVEIKSLYENYPDFEFVGVHSSTIEERAQTVDYFARVDLPFPVVRDTGAKLADEFKAQKTPHVFVVLPDGTMAFQGGISSSMHFEDNVDRKYLREALRDLSEGRKVRTPQARTLGCVIARGGKSDW
jgi:hypothetical protein